MVVKPYCTRILWGLLGIQIAKRLGTDLFEQAIDSIEYLLRMS